MSLNIEKLRHPKESLYGTISLIIGGLIWLALIVPLFLAALILGPFVFISLYISQQFFKAVIYGDAVRVGKDQFPKINEIVLDAAHQMGVKNVPETFIVNAQGATNALAIRFVGARFIILYSSVVDLVDEKQLKMLIGHEMAHHAAGHLNYFVNFLRIPAFFLPFLGAAFSRARELTCDRIGAAFADDLIASKHALIALSCGSTNLMPKINEEAFLKQEMQIPPIMGFIHKIYSYYPRMTQRILSLDTYFESRGKTQNVFAEKPVPNVAPKIVEKLPALDNNKNAAPAAAPAPKIEKPPSKPEEAAGLIVPQAAKTEMHENFCGHCGAKNSANAKFCAKCGGRIGNSI